MAADPKRTDPDLWEEVKARITAGDKGGKADQWSARKAQMAVAAYRKAGGGYAGDKAADNSLVEWTKEDWGTRSGEPSGRTHERYLPRRARDALSDDDYARTTAAKRADAAKGRQFSAQPIDVADRTARYRGDGEPTKADLLAEARTRNVPGRSTMTKAELAKALAR